MTFRVERHESTECATCGWVFCEADALRSEYTKLCDPWSDALTIEREDARKRSILATGACRKRRDERNTAGTYWLLAAISR